MPIASSPIMKSQSAEKTIKNSASMIFSKLRVSRRAEAAAYFVLHRKDRGR